MEKTYKEYISSGISWIGDIPTDWNIRKGKTLYSIRTGKLDANAENPEGEYPFFTCSMYPKKIDNYAFDCEALLVAGNGIVGFTQYYNGKFNAYQRTYVLSDFKDVYPIYLKYYVSNNLSTEVAPNSVGSVIQFIKLSDLQNFNIALPSYNQQVEIANFLENRCSQIDSLISLQEEMISELQSYKISYITKIVTSGIKEYSKLKDSGVDWIGQIPETWTVTKFKNLFRIKKDIAGKLGLDVLSVTQKGLKIKDLSKNEGQLAQDYSKYQLVSVEDFVMNHMDLLTGFVDLSAFEGVTSPDYRTFRTINNNITDNHYYLKIFQICYWTRLFYNLGQGVSTLGRWRLPAEQQNNFMLPVPPLEEQKEIAVHLDKKMAQIDSLIDIKEKKICELKDYKKSIIFEYVTGKKRV